MIKNKLFEEIEIIFYNDLIVMILIKNKKVIIFMKRN